MRKFYLLRTLLIFTILHGSVSFAQDFSNKGKDFWVAYGYHQVMTTGNLQEMVLYFATDQVTNITISIPGNGYSQTLISPAGNNVLTSAVIPKTGPQDVRLNAASSFPEDKGIHITSDRPIVAYAHIYNSSVSGASILFPTNTLGKEYYSINYNNISNTQNANCWFYVIAADPGTTTVEITPSADAIGHTAGIPFTVNLTQGQVYNVMGIFNTTGSPLSGTDLTGSTIKSIASGSGPCKKIAVFSGSGRISITCNGSSSSSDNYMVQAFPKAAWGKKYLTSSTGGNQSNNIYRVCVQDPATVVTLNGAPIGLPLQNNFYYEIAASATAKRIEADKPILVAQYLTSQGACGNGTPGDPEVIYLSSVEQNISKVLWNATPNFNITQHYYNVIIPNTGSAISSFKLDGTTVPAASFLIHPQDPGYSYLIQSVTQGQHTIQSDSGFNAIAYGYGNAESYGYNAGTNIKDIYQQVGVSTEFGIETTPSVCTGSPFRFKISLPYQPLQLVWNLSGLPGSPANVTQTGSPFVPSDSTTFVNGRQIWWYSLPAIYTVNTVGIFPVIITAENSGIDNCGNTQEIDFNLEVSDPPVAGFTWLSNNCALETVQFNDASITVKPTYRYSWNFGDPASGASNISTLKNPIHLFSSPGTYTVTYSNITTPGCLSNAIIKPITIASLPTAAIDGTTTVCLNSSSLPNITFTATGGTAPYTFTYTINGGPNQTVTTTSGNLVTVAVPTTVAGTFVYSLVNVVSNGSVLCRQLQTGSATITVTSVAIINLTSAATTTSQSVCQNVAITNITYAIGGGATGATVSGLPTGITGVYASGIFTISGTPMAVSPFTYTVTTTGPCPQQKIVTGTITVNPDASITLTSAVSTIAQTVCFNTTIADITYAVGGGGTGATVAGLPAGITGVFSGGVFTVSGSPAASGMFTYTITTTGTCVQQGVTGSITVNPLPTPNFTFTAPECEGKTITFNDVSIPNSGNLNNWQWNFGDATTGNGSSVTHTFARAGAYNVSLTVATDKGCVSNPPSSKPVTISVNPKIGFIVPEVCINDVAAVFIDTSKILPGAINAWKWDFGDPVSGPLNTSTTQNGTHLYTATGSYPVKHIAYSATGCSDTIIQNIFINGANPVTDFLVSSPAALCANDSILITNLSTVNPGSVTKVEIYWDNAGAPGVFDTDDFPVNGKVYKHKYPAFQTPLTKNYTIRFRAYSGTLCVNDRIRIITLNASPKVQFNNIPNICLDAAPYQIMQASEIGAVPGTFAYSGPGVTAGGLFTPSIAGAGTHNIKYTFTSTTGGCIDTLTKTIHVYEPAVAAFSFAAPACETKIITFNSGTSVSTEGVLTLWTWDFGDGSPLIIKNTSAPFTHTFAAVGAYPVKLTVTTSNGCLSTPKTTIVTVNPQPKTNFGIPASVCLPDANVTFNNLSSIADGTEASFNYLWNFGDPASGPVNISTGKNPSHTYITTGPFNVNLQVTTAAGCVHDTTIILNTLHPQPVASFNTDKTDVCIGGDFMFTDNTNPLDGTTTQWNWTLDDGNVKNTPTFTYTYAATGTYNAGLFIFNSNGCRSTTANKTVFVNPYPAVNAGPDKFVLEGGQVTLTPALSIGAGNVTYLWTPPTGLNNPAAAFPVASPTDDITYTLTVTSDKGCAARPDQVFVKVLKAPAVPNIFSPNGDGIHDRFEIKYLETYPGTTIDIYNRYGQLVYHSVGYTRPWDGTVNGKDVPVGTYYYVVDPKNGRKKIAGYVDVIR